MPAYVVFTREKTRDAAPLEEYRPLGKAVAKKHGVIFRAYKGRHEVMEGPSTEAVFILEFPTFEAAKAWYQSPEYQAASEHRHRAGDYRVIITEGLAPK
jgi:uncharacterized protein (DUF1330 family)